MRKCRMLLTLGLGAGLLVSCAGNGFAGPDDIEHGPFDANGNYVEAWANGRPKSSKRKSNKKVAKKKAKPERKQPTITKATKRQPEWLSKKKPTTSTVPKTKTKSNDTSTTPSKSKPKAKSQAVVIKPKTKPPKRHVVSRGDTLYNISRRYGSTVNSIQKANGLSGTSIRLGQTLLVPLR